MRVASRQTEQSARETAYSQKGYSQKSRELLQEATQRASIECDEIQNVASQRRGESSCNDRRSVDRGHEGCNAKIHQLEDQINSLKAMIEEKEE